MSLLHSFFKLPSNDEIQPTVIVSEEQLEKMKNAPRPEPSIVVVQAVDTSKSKV